MSQALATAQSLLSVSNTFTQQREKFQAVKTITDNVIAETMAQWKDPVGTQFVARYSASVQELEKQLIPTLDICSRHLAIKVQKILQEYLQ